MTSIGIQQISSALDTWPTRLATVLLALLLSGVAAAADITLQANTTFSQEGYFVLSWQAADADSATITLQQAANADFETISELIVPLTGTHTITGLANGDYWFRAGSPVAGWSNPVNVEVAHHSLVQAMAFFALGLLLFLCLCGAILIGARQTHGEPS